MRRFVAMLAAAMLVLTVGGCSMTTESRLDEYKAEGEALAGRMTEMIPADLAPVMPHELDSRGRMLQNPVSADPSPNDSAWWQVDAYVELVQEPGASEQAGEAIVAAMADDGWAHSQISQRSNESYVTQRLRKGEWTVEVSWSLPASEMFQTVSFVVRSPDTTRGDHDEIHS